MSIFDSCLNGVLTHLGEDAIFKGNGSLNESCRVKLDTASESIDPGTGVVIISEGLRILVNLSTLSRKPVRDDIFTINSVNYEVTEVETDGENGATVYLIESD